MRLTYSDILSAHFRNIGMANLTADTVLLADFQYNLGNRYQMVMGTLSNYINQDNLTTSTVAAQQYYSYPPGTVGIDTATITIGSRIYPLTPIYSQAGWDSLNAIPFYATIFPQNIFPRKDDFGVWPIPQDVYTITLNRFFRDRNLLVADYLTGTVTVTSGSTAVVGVNTTFTAAMVGRWFTVTDTTVPGQGYWYRIASVTNSTNLVLENDFSGTTTAGITYRIGESPEMPEEGHAILAAGTAADYYAGIKNAPESASSFDNLFWTGSMGQSSRDVNDPNVIGGLIGILRKYKDRERDPIVLRMPGIYNPRDKIWSVTIS